MPESLNQPRQPLREGYHGFYATDETCPVTVDQLKETQKNPKIVDYQRENLNLEELEDGAIVELVGNHHLAHYILRKEGNVISLWHSADCGPIECPIAKFNSSVEGIGREMHDVVGLKIGNGRVFPSFDYKGNKDGQIETQEPDEFWVDNLKDIRILKNGDEGIL